MVLLLRDDREPRLDLLCRRPILLGSSTSSTSPVSCATAMQRFGSDGSNSGHGGCALRPQGGIGGGLLFPVNFIGGSKRNEFV